MTLYYILRDRIPFILSIIWVYRDQIRHKLNGVELLDYLGYYFLTVTGMTLGATLILMFMGKTLFPLVYFHWSFPSPVEWGLFIIGATVNLHVIKKIPVFESYYLSFLSCLGGGWVYEILYGIPYWVRSGFSSWNWIKFNLSKVFFFEFQIFCLPIVSYLIYKNYLYEPEYFKRARVFIFIVSVVCFYIFGLRIAPYFHRLGQTIGDTGYYAWILRVPMILILY
jgi:hypothetical protein